MDFFSSSGKGKKDGKKSGLFSKKNEAKSERLSPPRHRASRSPPPSYLTIKRSETEYDFPVSDEQRPYWRQPASERIPNSHIRPPIHGYGTPDRRRDHGKERMQPVSYEPETNAEAGNRTPERRRRSTEHSREHHDRVYEAEVRSNASPFHPFRSPSPSPYHTIDLQSDRRRDQNRDQYEAMYEPEVNTRPLKSAPTSPFHPAGSRSPPPYRTPGGHSNHGKDQYEDLYEQDGEVTPRTTSPPSPFHPIATRSPPPFGTPDHPRNYHDDDQFETMYEPDGDLTPRNSAPPSPLHRGAAQSQPPYYSSSDDDDNRSTYLYPEIARPLSANSTPIHHSYQIVAAEHYEQDKQFEPPELPDESQSFTLQEIAKMRGLKSDEIGKEEFQSMISEAYVSVANYKVRQSVSQTLQAILDKHGDIAASSKLQAISTRSYYLESLAAAVMELQSTVLRDLTKTRVAEIAAVVKDMESVKIDVSWLKTAMAELAEAVEYFGQYDTVKVEREVCERDLKAGKEVMDEMTAELEKREKEIKECREKVTVVAGKLGQLEMKGTRLNKNLEVFQSKVEKFEGEAVFLQV